MSHFTIHYCPLLAQGLRMVSLLVIFANSVCYALVLREFSLNMCVSRSLSPSQSHMKRLEDLIGIDMIMEMKTGPDYIVYGAGECHQYNEI